MPFIQVECDLAIIYNALTMIAIFRRKVIASILTEALYGKYVPA